MSLYSSADDSLICQTKEEQIQWLEAEAQKLFNFENVSSVNA